MNDSIGGITIRGDLRPAWNVVRDQGSRGTCLACATSDGHSQTRAATHLLSAEYLFHHSVIAMGGGGQVGLTFDAVESALQSHGQPVEIECPLQKIDQPSWSLPAVSDCWYGSLVQMPAARKAVIENIHSGKSVILGILLVDSFLRGVQNEPHIVSSAGQPSGGHAVLGVGFGSWPGSDGDDLILIRNSWGCGWGANGYAWLPVEYLDDKLIGYRTVEPH